MSWETSPLAPRIVEIDLDGVRISAHTARHLISAYAAAMDHRGVRLLPGWEDRVWQAMADKYPRYVHKTPEKAPPVLGLATAISFMKFLTARIQDGSLVSEEEARRRAAICMACPLRTDVGGCPKCKRALKLLIRPPVQIKAGFKPGEVPPGCLACGCFLPLKVWIPRHQLGAAEDFPYSEACWMREPEPEPSEPASASPGS